MWVVKKLGGPNIGKPCFDPKNDHEGAWTSMDPWLSMIALPDSHLQLLPPDYRWETASMMFFLLFSPGILRGFTFLYNGHNCHGHIKSTTPYQAIKNPAVSLVFINQSSPRQTSPTIQPNQGCWVSVRHQRTVDVLLQPLPSWIAWSLGIMANSSGLTPGFHHSLSW